MQLRVSNPDSLRPGAGPGIDRQPVCVCACVIDQDRLALPSTNVGVNKE